MWSNMMPSPRLFQNEAQTSLASTWQRGQMSTAAGAAADDDGHHHDHHHHETHVIIDIKESIAEQWRRSRDTSSTSTIQRKPPTNKSFPVELPTSLQSALGVHQIKKDDRDHEKHHNHPHQGRMMRSTSCTSTFAGEALRRPWKREIKEADKKVLLEQGRHVKRRQERTTSIQYKLTECDLHPWEHGRLGFFQCACIGSQKIVWFCTGDIFRLKQGRISVKCSACARSVRIHDFRARGVLGFACAQVFLYDVPVDCTDSKRSRHSGTTYK